VEGVVMCDTKFGADIWFASGLGGVPTADAEDCRRQSKACRQLSTTAQKPEEKKFWMCLAKEWLKLAEMADKSVTMH
jgi:ribosomal protein S7